MAKLPIELGDATSYIHIISTSRASGARVPKTPGQTARTMEPYDPNIGPCIRVIITHPHSRQGTKVTGLIDTGSSITAVKKRILDRFAHLTGNGLVDTNAAQPTSSNLYEANLSLELGDAPPIVFPIHHIVRLYEFHRPDHPNIDMLVGRDILGRGRLVVDGPNRRFKFEMG
jgi:hypothetical protein